MSLEAKDNTLLGRVEHTVDLDGSYSGSTVLITGGGGSIGSAIARRLLLEQDVRVVLLDRSEAALMRFEQETGGCELYLADVTSQSEIRAAMQDIRPDHVFHAAAYKHVSFLQNKAQQAHKNNVLGTVNALGAAIESGAKSFVFISTDKAVNPSCVMGRTKRIAENHVRSRTYNSQDTKLSIVRFGNVMGSSGSVLEIWQRQLDNGQPLTITDTRMSRFLMTLDEAAGLVLLANQCSDESGGTYLLNMGEPVPVIELARRFLSTAGKDSAFAITGIRDGEKLDEQLHDDDEAIESTMCPQIVKAVQRQTAGDCMRLAALV